MVSYGRTLRVSAEYGDEVVARANDLYWHSEASVNGIATELDLSKGALYEILTHYPAGLPCPNGDGELGYANRTAKEREFVSCSACGFEEQEDVVRELMDQAGRFPELEIPPYDEPRALTGPNVERLLLGSALVGFAAGVLIAGLFRRR